MSAPTMSGPSASGEFQLQFGSPPGSPDVVAECKKWERLCADLLAERETLRAELARVHEECETYRRSLFHHFAKDYQPTFTEKERDEAILRVNDRPTLQDIINEIEHAPEK